MIGIIWLALVISEAGVHRYIIEVQKHGIDHLLASIIRIVYSTTFFIVFIMLDYEWYWALIYITSTHQLLFPESLNLFRGKHIGYMDSYENAGLDEAEDSTYDMIISKYIKPFPWLVLRVISAIFCTLAFFYNIPFKELFFN